MPDSLHDVHSDFSVFVFPCHHQAQADLERGSDAKIPTYNQTAEYE